MKETEEHLIKYLPLQIIGLIFELFRGCFKSKYKQRFKENANQIAKTLEQRIVVNEQITYGNINFKKREYIVPQSILKTNQQNSPTSTQRQDKNVKKGKSNVNEDLVKDYIATTTRRSMRHNMKAKNVLSKKLHEKLLKKDS